MNAVLDTASRVFGVSSDELCGPSREQRIVHARFAVAWALRKHDPRRSFRAIGEALGGRDHTTILHAVNSRPRMYHHRRPYGASHGRPNCTSCIIAGQTVPPGYNSLPDAPSPPLQRRAAKLPRLHLLLFVSLRCFARYPHFHCCKPGRRRG